MNQKTLEKIFVVLLILYLVVSLTVAGIQIWRLFQ